MDGTGVAAPVAYSDERPSMLWRLSFMKEDENQEESFSSRSSTFLMVNRAQVMDAACSACGGRFAASPTGDKAMVATVGDGSQILFFCSPCGENIIGRANNDDARGHYAWDWAVPVRNGANREHQSCVS